MTFDAYRRGCKVGTSYPDKYDIRNWNERLERATRFMNISDPLDETKIYSNVRSETGWISIAKIRHLAKYYGAKKVPMDRYGAAHALARSFVTK